MALTNQQIIDELGLRDIDDSGRAWNIMQVSCKSGKGLVDSFAWIKKFVLDKNRL